MAKFDKTRVWVTSHLSVAKLLGVENEKTIIFDNDMLKCVGVLMDYFQMVNTLANTTKKRKTRTSKKSKKPKKSKKKPKRGKTEKNPSDEENDHSDEEKETLLVEKPTKSKKSKKTKKDQLSSDSETYTTRKISTAIRKFSRADQKKRNDVMLSFGKIDHALIQELFEEHPVEIIKSMNCMLSFFAKIIYIYCYHHPYLYNCCV
jgi:hypothetical protein